MQAEIVIAEHYDTLQVSPGSNAKTIRAAYLRLMRLYHPDGNPSPDAQAKVRQITAAYAILRDPAQRARYDAGRMLPPIPASATFTPKLPVRLLPPWLALALGALAVVALVALVFPPVTPATLSDDSLHGFGTRANALPEPAAFAGGINRATPCASSNASEFIKRELFRSAGRIRGKDQAEFARLAGYALLRFDPTDVKEAGEPPQIRCSATVAIELPPGLAVSDGQRRLVGAIHYLLRQGNGGAFVGLSLNGGEGMARLLATLAKESTQIPADVLRATAVAPSAPSIEEPSEANREAAAPDQPPPKAQPVKLSRPQTFKDPSFNCSSARTWATVAVCQSASLAALDRQMASLWGDSMAQADAARRAQLLTSDRGFLRRRDACASEACVQGAYNAQIHQIAQIMSRQ